MKRKIGTILIIVGLIIAIIAVVFIGEKRSSENVKSDTTTKLKSETNEPKKEEKKEEKEENNKENSDKKEVKLVENTVGVPVLYYHSIGDDGNGDELVTPTAKFKEQMKYLKDNGYSTLSMEELYGYIKNGNKIPEKPIVITFDDGYKNNYINAYPVLKEYGFKGTIFVITSMVDKVQLYLTREQIAELSKNNIDIASHTVNHENLNATSKENTVKTLKESKEFLEKIINKKVEYIAYPFGNYDDATIKSLKEAGYKMAFTTEKGWSKGKTDEYKVKRVYVNGNSDMNVFKERLTNPNYN